uniref:Pentatricopeptide repeat-containing protein n=1 Tax=Zea mays TaxID=4577 RepID=A0A804NKE7_MAIZE
MLPRHGHVCRLLLLPRLRPMSTSATTAFPPTDSAPFFSAAPGSFLDPTALAPDDAIALLPSVADSEGSAAALALFRRLSSRPDMRRLMRLYATAATAFVARGNLPMAHEAARAMVAAFAEAGRLREAADMLLELRSHGLPLVVETANWVLRVGLRHPGCFAHAREAFDGMARAAGGVRPDHRSFRALVLGCCREGRFEEADALLAAMWAQGFCLDSATCTVVVRAFCRQGRFRNVTDLFRRMSEMGTPPNMVNYSAWIDGLCERGYVKQAFHVLEEMVGKGLKPNVYTHTSLIDGLCKIGWMERAFRLFLKLVKSSSYKPNVHTYTVMIGGYCKEGKLARAEMLLGRMVEQGLAPNTNTYTTLIHGHCKGGSFDRAFELMNKMKLEGFLPNIYTYNAIIGGFCKKGKIQEAYKVLRMATSQGLHLDKDTVDLAN